MSEQQKEFIGVDMFGRKILGVRGNKGACIFSRFPDPDDGPDDDTQPVMSFSAESMKQLAEWISNSEPNKGVQP